MNIIGYITLLGPLVLHAATAAFSFITYLKAKALQPPVQPKKDN